MASSTAASSARSRGGTVTTAAHRSPGRVLPLIYLVLSLYGIAALVPFVYMVMTSLKSYGSLITNNFWPWPPFGTEPVAWDNYTTAIANVGWDRQWGTWLFVRY